MAKEFEGGFSVQHGVEGLVDDSEPTHAEQALNLEVADLFADEAGGVIQAEERCGCCGSGWGLDGFFEEPEIVWVVIGRIGWGLLSHLIRLTLAVVINVLGRFAGLVSMRDRGLISREVLQVLGFCRG